MIGRAPSVFPGEDWEAAEHPEQDGWSIEKLAEARGIARGAGSTSLMVVHRGKVVLSYGQVERRSHVASVRKSLLSALYGIHVAAGTIDLSATLEELGIDDNEPSLTPEEKRATIADLLKSRSGVFHPSGSNTPEMLAIIPPRGAHQPGTYWCYNNWDFNALGTIFEQLVGRSIFVDFKERIADEIGMQDFEPEHGWYAGQHYSKHLAYHMNMSGRDLARFGLLFLNGGSWNGKQIVPSVWVAESTRTHTATSWGAFGYGYMWWTGRGKPVRTASDERSYSARGYRGQILHVYPDLDLLFVHRYAGSGDSDTGIPDQKIADMLDLVLGACPASATRTNGLATNGRLVTSPR
jgi:CubicO group peptidase (beta-lactamase class C family)